MVTRKSAIQYERSLKKYLESKGFFVIRAGGSGARSKKYTPDLVAIKNGKILIIVNLL